MQLHFFEVALGFPQPVHPSQQYAYQTPVPGNSLLNSLDCYLENESVRPEGFFIAMIT